MCNKVPGKMPQVKTTPEKLPPPNPSKKMVPEKLPLKKIDPRKLPPSPSKEKEKEKKWLQKKITPQVKCKGKRRDDQNID